MKNWAEVQGALTEEIVGWAGEQNWANAMANCRQDAQWHAEGDVWTHTRMVVAQAESLAEWPTLERDSQLMLLFTALLHDSGKPATTHVDQATGRTRSPKHSLAGAGIARLSCGTSAVSWAARADRAAGSLSWAAAIPSRKARSSA